MILIDSQTDNIYSKWIPSEMIKNDPCQDNPAYPATEKNDMGLRIHPEAFVDKIPALDYKQNVLHIEGISVDALIEKYETPLYVYSKTAILDAYTAYTTSFAAIDHQVCYAVKANSNLAVLGVLAKAGSGFDLVSGGELARVLAVGADPSKIVFSGVGKSHADIKAALTAGIGCFNVESLSELDTINTIAGNLGVVAPISLRVNPDVDAKTHPYISTGLKDNKFGISHDVAIEAYQYADKLEHLNVVGIDCHIGSQLTEITPFVAALDKLCELIDSLKHVGIELTHIDLGGGLGVTYLDEVVAEVNTFAEALLPKLQELGLKVFFEPGRSIVANAGVLLTSVDVLKPTAHKNFAIVDAAMNDLIRPSLYQAEMAIIPAKLTNLNDERRWDIVGAVCETGDFLAKNRMLALTVNDVLAVTGAGAYGFVMSSNYNSRPRCAEVMVEGNQHQLVRKRETIEQLFVGESQWQFD